MPWYGRAASEPGGGPNEDWAGLCPDAVVVLDGVTVPAGVGTGCVHGTPCYVRQLGTRLLGGDPGASLPELLAAAISGVAALHAGTCDLSQLGAPSAAVGMLRTRGSAVEHLVLADVTILLGTTGGIRIVTDDRVSTSLGNLKKGGGLTGAESATSDRIAAHRRRRRNRPGGYWVAAADPAAAQHAITGRTALAELRTAAVLTDGAAQLVNVFGTARWPDVLDLLASEGPAELIRRVRAAEANDPARSQWPRFKPADDATAALIDLRPAHDRPPRAP